MFRLVAAAMAIDNERRRSFYERAPQRIDTGNDQRHRLHDPRAAALP